MIFRTTGISVARWIGIAVAWASVSPRIVNGKPTFTVQSQVALRYLLQYKNNLDYPIWTTLSITSGNGQDLILSDPTSVDGGQRFYRVEVQEDDNQ